MIQTWLPLPSFKDSVRSLSNRHLGLQRLHVLHVLEVLHDVEETELPVVYVGEDPSRVCAMWDGYEMQLAEYGLEACDEWGVRTGKRDKYYEPLARHLDWATSETSNMGKPPWFGEVEFHLSHQAALVKLNPTYYRSQFLVDISRPLIWPINE